MDADVVASFQFTGQDIPWLLAKWTEAQPDTPLLIWEPKEGECARWTYGEFQTATRRLAAGLAAKGITKGDKVVIHCDNCPEMVLAWYACAVLGAVGVTTNTRTVADEMSYFVQKIDAVAAITQPQYGGDGRSGGSRVEVDRRHRGQQRRSGQRRAGCPRLRALRCPLR